MCHGRRRLNRSPRRADGHRAGGDVRGPLCWLGAPQSGGRGAPAALRCVHFVLCHLEHQRARECVTCGVNDCGVVTFPVGPGDPAPDRGRRRRGQRPLPGIGAPAATPRSWRWGMWAEGSARAEPASPPWSPGRAAAPGGAQDLWGQQPPLPLSRPGPSRAHALRAACPGKAPRPLARASRRAPDTQAAVMSHPSWEVLPGRAACRAQPDPSVRPSLQ